MARQERHNVHSIKFDVKHCYCEETTKIWFLMWRLLRIDLPPISTSRRVYLPLVRDIAEIGADERDSNISRTIFVVLHCVWEQELRESSHTKETCLSAMNNRAGFHHAYFTSLANLLLPSVSV